MRHHHEEGRGPRGRHGDPSEHGDHGRAAADVASVSLATANCG